MTTIRDEVREINTIDRYLIYDKNNPLSFVLWDKNNNESYLKIEGDTSTKWTGINNISTTRNEIPSI